MITNSRIPGGGKRKKAKNERNLSKCEIYLQRI